MDRRKLVRYGLNKNIAIILERWIFFNILPPQIAKFALVDISLSGLRAQYVSSEIFPYQHKTLSIETYDGVVKIEHIQFKLISDYKHTPLPGNTYLRRCGIKFINLTEKHKRQLNLLIRDYF
jgi:hypothetical protein